LALTTIDVPVVFVLRLTATYRPAQYSLAYIIGSIKQSIVNEAASYAGFYEAAKREWAARCDHAKACHTSRACEGLT